jgi:hypothetical protein
MTASWPAHPPPSLSPLSLTPLSCFFQIRNSLLRLFYYIEVCLLLRVLKNKIFVSFRLYFKKTEKVFTFLQKQQCIKYLAICLVPLKVLSRKSIT